MIKFELSLYAIDTVRMAISSRRSLRLQWIISCHFTPAPIYVFLFDMPFHVALLSYQLILYQIFQHQQISDRVLQQHTYLSLPVESHLPKTLVRLLRLPSEQATTLL